jgi:rubrerythrin
MHKMKEIKENKAEKERDIGHASLKDLLGIAVRSEIDSHQTYTDLSRRFSNPLLKEKFQWLAYEESQHREILEHLFDRLFHGDELVVPDKPIEELSKRIEVTPSSTLVDILNQAMESERRSEDFYARLAGEVREDQPKKILIYLSRVEHSHLKMLEGEFSIALEFEDCAEKPIDKVVT